MDVTDKHRQTQKSLSYCYGTVATARRISQTSTGKLRKACQIATVLQQLLVRSHRPAHKSADMLVRLLWYCSNCSSDLTDKHRQAQKSSSDNYGTAATARRMTQTSTGK